MQHDNDNDIVLNDLFTSFDEIEIDRLIAIMFPID